jgi:hypothetical protein
MGMGYCDIIVVVKTVCVVMVTIQGGGKLGETEFYLGARIRAPGPHVYETLFHSRHSFREALVDSISCVGIKVCKASSHIRRRSAHMYSGL